MTFLPRLINLLLAFFLLSFEASSLYADTIKVMVVDSDRGRGERLLFELTRLGFDAFLAFDGMDGVAQTKRHRPDVVILDEHISLYHVGEFCTEIRKEPRLAQTYLVVLSESDDESGEVEVKMMEEFGVDYVYYRPVSGRAFEMRLKAMAKRPRLQAEDNTISVAGLTLDVNSLAASIDGQRIKITPVEFFVLKKLMQKPGRTFSRAELAASGINEEDVTDERTLDVHIAAIRRKLGNRSVLIETKRGEGYRFSPDAFVSVASAEAPNSCEEAMSKHQGMGLHPAEHRP